MPGAGQLAASFSRISVTVQKWGLKIHAEVGSLHVEEGRAEQRNAEKLSSVTLSELLYSVLPEAVSSLTVFLS